MSSLKSRLDLAINSYFDSTHILNLSYLGFLKTLKPFCVSNPNSSENQNAILRKKYLEFLRNLLTEEEKQEMQDEHIKERCELVELLLQQVCHVLYCIFLNCHSR